jgi:hypothetical protein
LRIASAASLTALPTALVLWLLPETTLPLWRMLAGALTYSMLYLPASVLCGCWQVEEKKRISELAGRLPAPLAGLLRKLLH